MQGPQGDDAFLDTTDCVEGDIIEFNDGELECVTPAAVISRQKVFVTSASFTGDLMSEGGLVSEGEEVMDGLHGADILCQRAADRIGSIVPEGEYVAFLSTPTVDGRDQLTPNILGYLRSDGVDLVANTKADLLDGDIAAIIILDEAGDPIPGFCAGSPGACAWTGSATDGTLHPGDVRRRCAPRPNPTLRR